MKLEIGKRYISRNGLAKWTITHSEHGYPGSYYGASDCGRTTSFTSHGSYYADDKESLEDLVGLIDEHQKYPPHYDVIHAIVKKQAVEYKEKSASCWNLLTSEHDLNPISDSELDWRVCPIKYIMIGDSKIIAPESQPLKPQTLYFTALVIHITEHKWCNYAHELEWLRVGVVFLKKEDALAANKAIIKLLTNHD